MDDRNDRRRDRPSWAEVDKLRDQSKARDRDPMQKLSSPAAMNAQKNYKAALERAFAAGKLDELAKTLARPNDSAGRRGPNPSPAAPVAASPASSPVPVPGPRPPIDAAPENGKRPEPAPAPVKDPDREHRLKLLAKVREAEGRDAVTRAIDGFLAKYTKLPDDFEILTRGLLHKNDDRVRDTLDQLTILVGKDKPRRGRALVAQLRFLEDTHGDPEIRALAAKVRGQL